MKIEIKWVYATLALLVITVIGLEMRNRKKISQFRAKLEIMQKELDSRYIPTKKGESFPKYYFDGQTFCNKGVAPRLAIIDTENNFKYYYNLKKFSDIDQNRPPSLIGKVNIEKRRVRFFSKENQQYKLMLYGYIYDWDDNGKIKGVETSEENFHVDFCDGERQ